MATANLQTTAEESTQALSVTFGQVQELLDTNKETNKALNQLIISVKDLMKDTSRNSVYPNASKPDVIIDGAVAEAPTPQGIGEWTKVEVMSLDEVIAEDEKAKQNYHDHWNQFKTSANTNTDAKKTLDAATYVFDHYQDLCKSFGGWPPQELLFNTALLNKHRDRLVQCLFLHEAQLSFSMSGMSERSRARFEYSRLPRLLMILIRMESRHRGGGLYHSHDAYIDAETVLRVLAEAGRWTYSDDSFFHPQGEALYSLAERCYRRGLLRQPEIEERALAAAHMTFFYDVASAIKFKHRFPDFLYNSLGDFFLEHRSLRIDEVIERAEKIFDHQMRHIGSGKDIYLKEAEGPSFAPSQFNIESLEQVGGLEIRWTDCLDQHLRISSRPHTIQIFAHPTWLYNQVDLQNSDLDIRFSTIQELEWTYALLFRPSSSKQLKQLQKYADACRQSVDNNGKQDVTFQDETIISHTLLLNQSVDSSSTLVKMAVDPKRHPAKDILGNYFQCPISPAIQNVLNPGKARSKSAPITAAITASPPYFEDMRFQMCATFRIEFRDQEGFDRFPYFGDRLRQLKTYMDMQKPRTFRQMWKDSRDSTSWWTFWAVLFFGGASVFLALASLSVSIAQTVGTFQASR